MPGGNQPIGIPAGELTGDVGPPDVPIMRAIRRVFQRDEPLVDDASFDNVLQPQELQLQFRDGIGTAETCRLDITWFRSGAYRFHYSDSADRHWRFDRHPNPHSPERHFHPPPDAPAHTAAGSCIEVVEPALVARAVHQLWRRAYETESLANLNTANNPP